MSTQIDLKEIERKAFRSTYQDGLWDIYYGLVVMTMAIFVYRPATGYSPTNLVLALVTIGLAYSLFWAGKKFITLPRMGQVRFGAVRQRKKTTLALCLGIVVLIQVGLLGLTLLGWLNPAIGAQVNASLKDHGLMDLAVAALGALIVGVGMNLTAYFSDFPRGYYIAGLMTLAVFLMLYINQPVYPVLLGGLIALPGLVLFVRFLQTHSRPGEEAPGE